MKFEEVLPAFREGKKISRPKENIYNKEVFIGCFYTADVLAEDWYVYEQPKPKVTRWKWAFVFADKWEESSRFLTEKEAEDKRWSEYKKLEYTATVFEE